jgi:hypothetical protein
VNTWPGLLAQLNKTFLLIRDVFGYALPGGVFIAIGLISKRFSLFDLQNLLRPYKPPPWAFFILLVAACYVVGGLMASTAYIPIHIFKLGQWYRRRKYLLYPLAAKDRPAHFDNWLKDNAAKVDLLKDNPTEVTGDLLEIRSRHAEFFVELERRETLMLLGGSTAVALLGGCLVFYWTKRPPSTLFAIGGVIVLIEFCTGISHLRRVRSAIREADRLSTAAPPPPTDPASPQFLKGLIEEATKALEE